MVIVSVLAAILMAIAIPTFIGAREHGRESTTRDHLNQAVELMKLARDENRTVLHRVIQNPNGNSSHRCDRVGNDLKTGKPNDPAFQATPCYADWLNVVQKLTPYAPSEQYVRNVFTDGWGYAILLDENENDTAWHCTRPDYLYSAGKRGRINYFQVSQMNVDRSLAREIPHSRYCDPNVP